MIPVATANTALGQHGAIQSDPGRANEYLNSAQELARLWRSVLEEAPKEIAACGYPELANATQKYFGKNQTALDCDVLVGENIEAFGLTAPETFSQGETCLALLKSSQPEFEEFQRLLAAASD